MTSQLSSPLALHDAQSVIAREHGFQSWMREHVEELETMLTCGFGATTTA